MEKAIRKQFFIFVLPTLIAFTAGFLLPFLMGIGLSFCRFTTVTDAVFTGLGNYRNVAAFTIAMLLTKGIRGTNLFRTVFFMPNLIGGIVLGYIWQILLNGVLERFGKTLTYSSAYGFFGLVILMNWQQTGYMMMIYIAGIQNIPDELA